MAVPNRPTAGAPIESAWGDLIHDTAAAVIGCQGIGNAITGTAGTFTPTAQDGLLSMVSGSNIVVPAGGLWEIWANVAGPGQSTGNPARCFVDIDQSGSFVQILTAGIPMYSSSWSTAAILATVAYLDVGKSFRIRFDAGVSGAFSLGRWVVLYRGADFSV